MHKQKTFSIIGGDLRQAYLANALASRENEYKIYTMFLDKDIRLSGRINLSSDIKLILPQSDVIIFPLPILDSNGYINTPLSAKKIKMEDCLDYILPDTVVLAGKIPQNIVEEFRARDITIIDYLDREEFAVLNAVATAEGALEIAMKETPTTIFGSNCVITGFGRISKALARLLHAFGAKVSIVARKQGDLAWAKSMGYQPVHISSMAKCLPETDILFNTVPAVILDEDKLSILKRNCLVIDLASKPGGVDFQTAKDLGIQTIWALSLPGKVAPITAGEIALDTILNILNERRGF